MYAEIVAVKGKRSATQYLDGRDERRGLKKPSMVSSGRFGDKYPKATACLEKDREELLAFYDFPAAHWIHIRTTNPIESTFSTVKLRTSKTRNCRPWETTLAMVFKLLESAQKRWLRIKGSDLIIGEVIEGVIFKDGIRTTDQSEEDAT